MPRSESGISVSHWFARHYSDAGASHGNGILENEPTRTERPETLASWAEFHEAVERLADPEREVFELVWYGGMVQQDVVWFDISVNDPFGVPELDGLDNRAIATGLRYT